MDINQIRQDLDAGLEEVNKGSELLEKLPQLPILPPLQRRDYCKSRIVFSLTNYAKIREIT